MIIVAGKPIEFRYNSATYTCHVRDVGHDQDGIVVDLLVPDEFKHAFKLGEKLSRWSSHRFQKFVISHLRDLIHKEEKSV